MFTFLCIRIMLEQTIDIERQYSWIFIDKIHKLNTKMFLKKTCAIRKNTRKGKGIQLTGNFMNITYDEQRKGSRC